MWYIYPCLNTDASASRFITLECTILEMYNHRDWNTTLPDRPGPSTESVTEHLDKKMWSDVIWRDLTIFISLERLNRVHGRHIIMTSYENNGYSNHQERECLRKRLCEGIPSCRLHNFINYVTYPTEATVMLVYSLSFWLRVKQVAYITAV